MIHIYHYQQKGQIKPVLAAFFCLTVLVGYLIFFSSKIDGLLRTLGLLITVSLAGVYLLEKQIIVLKDRRLGYLSYLFLLKLIILICIINFAWAPALKEITVSSGFDPGRYYHQAYELMRAGFDLKSSHLNFSINYSGIIFYYGVIFYLFGHNPFAPLLINCFVTLLATIMLLKVGYRIKPFMRHTDWTLGLVMFIPEIVWYDGITSREAICMSLLCFLILPAVALYKQKYLLVSRWKLFACSFAAFISLLCIRPQLVAIGGIAILLLFCVLGRFQSKKKLAILLCIVFMLFTAFFITPKLAPAIGGYDFSWSEAISRRFMESEGSQKLLSKHAGDWSRNSIGKRLIPKDRLEVALFAPARVAGYIVAPFPRIIHWFNYRELIQGNHRHWKGFVTACSSVVYIFLFPLALAATIDFLVLKKNRDWGILVVSWWIIHCIVSVSVLIIHMRYRIMFLPFLCASIWIGRYSSKKLKKNMFVVFYFLFLLVIGFITLFL